MTYYLFEFQQLVSSVRTCSWSSNPQSPVYNMVQPELRNRMQTMNNWDINYLYWTIGKWISTKASDSNSLMQKYMLQFIFKRNMELHTIKKVSQIINNKGILIGFLWAPEFFQNAHFFTLCINLCPYIYSRIKLAYPAKN